MARNGVARRGHQRRCVSALGDRIKRSEGLGKNRQSGVPRSVPIDTPVVAGSERTNHYLRLVCADFDRGRHLAPKRELETPPKDKEIERISAWIFHISKRSFLYNLEIYPRKNLARHGANVGAF